MTDTTARLTRFEPEGELAKAYDPREIEAGVYDWWDHQGYFQPVEPNGKEPFVIIMPPPNVIRSPR